MSSRKRKTNNNQFAAAAKRTLDIFPRTLDVPHLKMIPQDKVRQQIGQLRESELPVDVLDFIVNP